MKKTVKISAPLAALALVGSACAGGAGDDEAGGDAGAESGNGGGEACYASGDSVELVVPFGAGGGTDTTARLVAPFLANELGVDIQVVNQPGGGSILGANRYVNQTEPDGQSILLLSASTQVPAVLNQQGVEFAFSDLSPIAGFPIGGVIYSHADNEILQEATDLAGEEQSAQFTYAGQPATGGELRILLIFEMLNSDVNTVLGYDGRGPARVAWEQGESDVAYDTAPAYLANVEPLVEQGVANPLLSFGTVEDGELVRDDTFPDLPTVAEVYEDVYNEPPSGEAFEAYKTIAVATISLNKTMALHADAPQNCKDELTAAWEAVVEDEEFQSAKQADLGDYSVLLGEEVESAWNEFNDINPESIDWLLT
ncbi:tripartite tricarboxylate transporter substrate-binding protein, partial [Georgenia sp. 10Sc9-8]|nr:tripartite tricarboxylate transporter substrate-binding protein [Georgenia halotolerans]